jgi:hypothetical protein
MKMDDARLLSTWKLAKNGNVLMSLPRIGFIRSILMNHQCRRSMGLARRKIRLPSPLKI